MQPSRPILQYKIFNKLRGECGRFYIYIFMCPVYSTVHQSKVYIFFFITRFLLKVPIHAWAHVDVLMFSLICVVIRRLNLEVLHWGWNLEKLCTWCTLKGILWEHNKSCTHQYFNSNYGSNHHVQYKKSFSSNKP